MGRIWRAALVSGAAFAIPAVINAAIARSRRELLTSLSGKPGEYAWPLGTIRYQERGIGVPLVLLHGMGAGESSYEWRSNFEFLAERFHVYAPDLPGFGASDRQDMSYTAAIYIDAVADFLRDVVGEPAIIVASSISAAIAVKVAALRPGLVSRLVLVCPTGVDQLTTRPTGWSQFAYGALSIPALGTGLYNAMVSYVTIEKYLRENIYFDPTRVTPAITEQYYQSAHQRGAEFAIRSLVAGLLACDIREDLRTLVQPLEVIWGRHARISPSENARHFLQIAPSARLRYFENSGMLPHDEEADDFNHAIVDFAGAPALQSGSPAEITG